MKRIFIAFCLFALTFYPFSPLEIPIVNAASPGSVVINEIAWMGSSDSSSDEWIELYNTTSGDIDLTGWVIDDDNGASLYALSGMIPANSYFLIEDGEAATSAASDIIAGLSLANSGDSLVLKDETDQAIDTVNSTGTAWFAGNSSTYNSMERIDPAADGDIASNWADNVSGNGETGSLGTLLNATPKTVNSVFSGTPAGASVSFETLSINPVEGDSFTIQVSANNVSDLLSYGFDILYDPAVIEYVSAAEGALLSENGTVSTSFNEGLENGLEGKIVVGASRLTSPPSGVSGSGVLFELNFNALATGSTQLAFDTISFLSDSSGADLTASLNDGSVTVDAQSADPVSNLAIAEGVNRYELDLTWDAPISGADSYKILKKDTSGAFAEIANIADTFYTDADNLIPNHTYEYQVIAVKGSIESTAVSGQGADARGLKGDNTRSDRVDGRDLDNLARHYTLALGDANFDTLIDTTYDGIIDGSDLIDIGANWALTY